MSSKQSSKNVTELDKKRVIALRRQGVPSHVIAKAFGYRVQQVAAYVAHNTLRTAA